MPRPFVLAHLSDIHLGPLPRLPLAHLNAKRLLGLLNWHRSRKASHTPETLALLLADLAEQHCDHVAITGDLINIGLPSEYQAAADWLASVGSPERITVVPGNHDIYTRLRRDAGIERWRAYMAPRNAPAVATGEPGRAPGFPFIRRLGDIALIGVNSAVPTRPFHAGGRVGRAQLSQLAAALRQLGEDGLLRVVLIHHPPLPGQAAKAKALVDSADLAKVLEFSGCELVLHGHNHRFMLQQASGKDGAFPVIGVPSASLGRPHRHEALARYHILRIEGAGRGGRPSIELIARGLAGTAGPVVEIERLRIEQDR